MLPRLAFLLITAFQGYAWETSAGMCTTDLKYLTAMLDRKIHYDLPGGYVLTPSTTTYGPGEKIKFTIRHMEIVRGRSKVFKGFLAYGEGNDGKTLGTFTWQADANSEGGMPDECANDQFSSHTAANLKQKIILEWQAPMEDFGDITIKSMVYESMDFWNPADVTLTFDPTKKAAPTREVVVTEYEVSNPVERPTRDSGPSDNSPTPAYVPPPGCTDDSRRIISNAGTTCKQMIDMVACDINLRVLNPGAPDILLSVACPVTCKSCPNRPPKAIPPPTNRPVVTQATRPRPTVTRPTVTRPPARPTSTQPTRDTQPTLPIPSRPMPTPVTDGPIRPMPEPVQDRVSAVRPTQTVVQLIGSIDELSTLSTLINAPDYKTIKDLLNTAGPFTVFAPSNAAFVQANLDVTDIRTVLDALKLHVVQGSFPSSSISATQSIKTLAGSVLKKKELVVTNLRMRIQANNAQVIKADQMGINGVVHVVDSLVSDGPVSAQPDTQKPEIDDVPTCKQFGFRLKSKLNNQCLTAGPQKVSLSNCDSSNDMQMFMTKKNEKGKTQFHTPDGRCINIGGKLGKCLKNTPTAVTANNPVAGTYLLRFGVRCLVALKQPKWMKCKAKVKTHQWEVLPVL